MSCVSWWNVMRCSKLSTGHELAHCHLAGERGSRLIQEAVKYGEAAQQRVSDNGGSSRPYYWIMRRSIIRAAFCSITFLDRLKSLPLVHPSFLLHFSSSFSSSSSSSFANTISSYPFPFPLRHYFPLAIVPSLVREVIFSWFE